ncbi:hypothetical protein BKK54_05840 [Rodentibacter genomosp. 1]|uniref:UPF0208 membrane protein BKK54_05840 n=1 Tax=Rodentibacter genomosp. 1 TaxID=1908264 RepID=A0A1V3J5X2_9PAST|nr:terminus macrodomain insulation protein YfbV [Rodentibacter genomosp. 1]OOF50605.1 hypothetical protein BKK54_05840 [Rodentibacter genomosp. 1]
MSFFSILKQGQVYLNTWPKEAKLGIIFPENRIIKATGFAQKTMPLIAVFAIAWQQLYATQDMMAFSTAILTALFALLIPLQGLYWLGKRAKSPLNAQSAVWFYDICERLKKINEPLPWVEGQPTYQHLAEVLKKAEQRLERTFWQDI